jgi:hypothetical protein
MTTKSELQKIFKVSLHSREDENTTMKMQQITNLTRWVDKQRESMEELNTTKIAKMQELLHTFQ